MARGATTVDAAERGNGTRWHGMAEQKYGRVEMWRCGDVAASEGTGWHEGGKGGEGGDCRIGRPIRSVGRSLLGLDTSCRVSILRRSHVKSGHGLCLELGSGPHGGAVVRYSSFRRLASLLALLLALGFCAVAALRAQDRAASGATARPWWEVSKPAPAPASSNTVQPATQRTATPTAAADTKIYRLQRAQAGESKPLILDADEIATWTEKLGPTEYC